MKRLKFVLAGAAICGILALGAGLSLPEARAGGASRVVAAQPEAIVAVIVDVQAQPEWRKDVRRVEIDGEGWIETKISGERIRFEWTERDAGGLALRFSSDRGYTGAWRAVLAPAAGGTLVSVEERATISNPLARLLARAMFDPAAFSRSYLDALAARAERPS
jgi:hypothetical protein